MDKLNEIANQYDAGLFTAKEFLAKVANEINLHTIQTSEDIYTTPFADELANTLIFEAINK